MAWPSLAVFTCFAGLSAGAVPKAGKLRFEIVRTMPAMTVFALVGSLAGLWLQVFGSAEVIPLWLLAGSVVIWWLAGLAPLCGLLLLAISSLHCYWYLEHMLPDALVKQDVLLTGRVEDFPRVTEDVRTFVLRVESGSLAGRYQVRVYGEEPDPAAGETWRLKVRLKRPLSTANRAGFNQESWYLRTRIHGAGYVRKSPLNTRVSPAKGALSIQHWRSHIRDQIDDFSLDPEVRALLLGIIIGARDAIDRQTWGVLRATGTAHLMAISGMHIGLIAMLAWLPGRLLGWLLACVDVVSDPLQVARACSFTAAVIYASLAGGTVPTLRALCMVGLVLLFGCYRRQISLRQMLASAMLALLILDPLACLSPGFWLSFGAVGILATLATDRDVGESRPQCRSLMRRIVIKARRGIARFCSLQLRLSIGLALPLSLLFGQVSVVTFLANLLAVPAFSLAVLPPALFGGLCLLTGMPGGEPAILLAGVALGCLLKPLATMADWPGAVWFSGPISWAALAAACSGLLLLLVPRPVPSFMPGITLLALGLLRNAPPAVHGLRVEVLDVGQGLAVLLETKGHRMLYDSGGKWPGGDAGQSVLLPVLRASGIRKLDVLLVSHADSDHSGGASSLIGEIDIGAILTPAAASSSFPGALECRRGVTWEWDKVSFRVLHPDDRSVWSENNASCVLQVEYKGKRLLLPGDIEEAAERRLVNANLIDAAELVIAPHHGSKTSSSDVFVTESSPSHVVFSAGYANRWHFPAEAVVDRWMRVGSCVLTTAATGAIEFIIDDEGFRLAHTERAAFRRPWPLRNADTDHCAGTINSSGAAL